MQTPTRLLTYEEYLELPYTGDSTEFMDGKVVELNPPTGRHTDISFGLLFTLVGYIKAQGLNYVCRESSAQVDVRYRGRKRRGRKPDLFICTQEQWDRVSDVSAVFPKGDPPLLVVEILSPGNWRDDMGEKEADYATAEVREYWRVKPMEQWVEVLQLGEARMYQVKRFAGGDRIKSEKLPELVLTAAAVLEV